MNTTKNYRFAIYMLVAAVALLSYAFFFIKEDSDVCVKCNGKVAVSMGGNEHFIGDTTKRLYVIEDTTSGMVWIGVPGINQIGKK
jgi:hypothetical protein